MLVWQCYLNFKNEKFLMEQLYVRIFIAFIREDCISFHWRLIKYFRHEHETNARVPAIVLSAFLNLPLFNLARQLFVVRASNRSSRLYRSFYNALLDNGFVRRDATQRDMLKALWEKTRIFAFDRSIIN